MKKLLWVLLAALTLGMFSSCEKEPKSFFCGTWEFSMKAEDETSSMTDSYTFTLKEDMSASYKNIQTYTGEGYDYSAGANGTGHYTLIDENTAEVFLTITTFFSEDETDSEAFQDTCTLVRQGEQLKWVDIDELFSRK